MNQRKKLENTLRCDENTTKQNLRDVGKAVLKGTFTVAICQS